jgi:hypothetical protein
MNRRTLKKFIKRGEYSHRIFNTYHTYRHRQQGIMWLMMFFEPNQAAIEGAVREINKMR